MLYVKCCMLYVICCMLYVVCYMFYVICILYATHSNKTTLLRTIDNLKKNQRTMR